MRKLTFLIPSNAIVPTRVCSKKETVAKHINAEKYRYLFYNFFVVEEHKQQYTRGTL
jgi:hypothetical protein